MLLELKGDNTALEVNIIKSSKITKPKILEFCISENSFSEAKYVTLKLHQVKILSHFLVDYLQNEILKND